MEIDLLTTISTPFEAHSLVIAHRKYYNEFVALSLYSLLGTHPVRNDSMWQDEFRKAHRGNMYDDDTIGILVGTI